MKTVLSLCLLTALASTAAAQPAPVTITVTADVQNRIDHRLFGQFLERPSWGTTRQETGPERAYDAASGTLHPSVVAIMREVDAPVIRWPGGTDVDYMNWTDMIDNAPDRTDAARPGSVGHTGEVVSNRFGMDEALNLIESVGAEPILTVNLLDGLSGAKPLAEAARHAAELVAYTTLPVGAPLPAGMADYPAARALNGRTEPWNVPYIQIGNEWFLYRGSDGRVLAPFGSTVDADLKENMFATIEAYITAIRAVNPNVRIIVDGMNDWFVDAARARLGDRIDYMSIHQYHPWAIDTIGRDNDFDGTVDETFDVRTWVTDPANRDETWYAWTAPRRVDADGLGVSQISYGLDKVRAAGYRAVSTEWNWNGRFSAGDSGGFLETYHGRGIGSTSYLFELMRRGGDIDIATQSMYVGWNWQIAGIAYPVAGFAYRRPTLVSTELLSHHHGDRRVRLAYPGGLPTYAQPFKMGDGILPKAAVALVDPVATRDDDMVYIHLINRSFDTPQTVRLDLSAYVGAGTGLGTSAMQYRMLGSPIDDVGGGQNPYEVAWIDSVSVAVGGPVVEVTLPAASLSTVAIPVGRTVAAEGTPDAGAFRLAGVSPNPATASATVRFDLAEAADVSVRVFDVLGREVLTAAPHALPAGAGQTLVLDVQTLPPGVYVVRLSSGGAVASGRFTVAR